MRTLYHFRYSPFSRRTRLALAQKALDVTLREGRENPQWLAEAQRLVPLRTIPVLVDGERALGDSNAIAQWLERAYPDLPRLWPDERAHPTRAERGSASRLSRDPRQDVRAARSTSSRDPRWCSAPRPRASWSLARRRLVSVASERRRPLCTTIVKSGWSTADMWLFTAVAWLEGLPARAATTSPNIAQVLTLGETLPAALSLWADAHRDRSDVRALG